MSCSHKGLEHFYGRRGQNWFSRLFRFGANSQEIASASYVPLCFFRHCKQLAWERQTCGSEQSVMNFPCSVKRQSGQVLPSGGACFIEWLTWLRLHGPGGSSERPSMDDAGQDPCYKVSSLRAISASTSPSLSPRTRPTPASAEWKHFGRNVATETSRSSQSFPESTQHRAKASQCSSYYAPHNHLCSIANFYVNKNCVYAFHYKWKTECTFCVKNAMCLIPAYCLFVRK